MTDIFIPATSPEPILDRDLMERLARSYASSRHFPPMDAPSVDQHQRETRAWRAAETILGHVNRAMWSDLPLRPSTIVDFFENRSLRGILDTLVFTHERNAPFTKGFYNFLTQDKGLDLVREHRPFVRIPVSSETDKEVSDPLTHGTVLALAMSFYSSDDFKNDPFCCTKSVIVAGAVVKNYLALFCAVTDHKGPLSLRRFIEAHQNAYFSFGPLAGSFCDHWRPAGEAALSEHIIYHGGVNVLLNIQRQLAHPVAPPRPDPARAGKADRPATGRSPRSGRQGRLVSPRRPEQQWPRDTMSPSTAAALMDVNALGHTSLPPAELNGIRRSLTPNQIAWAGAAYEALCRQHPHLGDRQKKSAQHRFLQMAQNSP